MGKSVITDDLDHCIICGSVGVHMHHVFFGTANRKLSDKFGYIVPLCFDHHLGYKGVHTVYSTNLYLKKMCQRHYEEHHGTRDDFIKTFGRSYL